MRVLHLTHGIGGGAGRAVLRISAACEAAGLSSAVLNVAHAADRAGVYQAERQRIQSAGEMMDTQFARAYLDDQSRGNSNTLFSLPYPSPDLLGHPLVQSADIVNLHWMSWVLAPCHIRELATRKPVIWTLHDFWPVTGGCHYPSGCKQYETECFSCPQVNDPMGLVAASFLDKRLNLAGLSGLQVTAPSRFLADAVGKSRVFEGRSISHIENPIELDIFSPLTDRREKRRALGLADDECVLVFGNYHNGEIRKGGSILRDALQQLFASADAGARKFAVITFGTGHDLPATDRVKTLSFSSVGDDSLMRDILGMADVLCFPSVEDNYPNAIIEAAACGTPAIAFRMAGMQEMVVHGDTGLLVDTPGSATAFAEALATFHDSYFGAQAMRDAARARVEQINAPAAIGSRFKALYQAALDDFASAGTPEPWSALPAQSPLQERFLKTLSVSMSDNLSDAFWGFPIRAKVERHLQAHRNRNPRMAAHHGRQPVLVEAPWPEGRKKLLLVATHHDHHAAHSGPLQFARHLDRHRFDWRHMRVPLGGDLCDNPAAFSAVRDQLRDWQLPVLADQLGALMAELSVTQAFLQDPGYADLVHYIDGDHSGWLVPLALRALGVSGPRFAMTLHQPPAFMRTAISAPLLAGIDRLFLMSESQKAAFGRKDQHPPLEVTPHGVDTGFFSPDGPGPTNGRSRPYVLLSVGHWLRDYDTAFAAVEALIAEGFAIEYRIVGAPRGKTYPSFVTVLNGIDDEALRAEYRDADIFFMPLKDSTANNAILEAMACGLPVVSTDTGGVRAMTGDAARLCAPGQTADYVAALSALLGDREARTTAACDATAQVQQFSWSRIGGTMSDAYGTVLSATRPPHGGADMGVLSWDSEAFAAEQHRDLIEAINTHAASSTPLSDALRDVARRLLLDNFASLQDAAKYPLMLALSRLGSLLP